METSDEAPQFPRMLWWHTKKIAHWDYEKIDMEIEPVQGVVHLFITHTRAESVMDYGTSFKPLDDVFDEKIDCLMRDLEGVMHLTVVEGSFFEHVIEAEGGMDKEEDMEALVRTPPSNWQTGTPSTSLPTHPQSKLVDLINGLHNKFDLLSNKFDILSSTIYEKIDKLEERVQRGEEKVDVLMEMEKVQPKKRET